MTKLTAGQLMLSLSAVYVKALILLELTMLITKFTITVQLTDMSICMYVCMSIII